MTENKNSGHQRSPPPCLSPSSSVVRASFPVPFPVVPPSLPRRSGSLTARATVRALDKARRTTHFRWGFTSPSAHHGTEPPSSPSAGGRGQRRASQKMQAALRVGFFVRRAGASRALFSLWLLSLLSKRKRESDNVPPLGKRRETAFLESKETFLLVSKENFAFLFLLGSKENGSCYFLLRLLKRK